jgi:hypothetical protein
MGAYKCQAIYDTDKDIAEQGTRYFNCTKCLQEMPANESPKSWVRTQAAITREGHLQIWCTRHDLNVALISLEVKTIQ